MHKPDKATTERNAKVLRELVKQPDNKLCADCKRNDPRWASWNLGVYLCIRCSGVHRGMGTHISKVKSIDLDMWTPEQMQSIQKWGNRRANLYWEAHLKAGHVPPDHKMESFIRSKYESRRWAMDGPPPSDPSVLESEDIAPPPPPSTAASPTTASLSTPRPASPSIHSPSAFRQSTAHSHSQSRQLLSAAVAGRVQVPPPSSAQPQPHSSSSPVHPPPPRSQKAEDDLFSLDFHATSSPNTGGPPQPPAKDVKQDILALFSAAPPPSSAAATASALNAFGHIASVPPTSSQPTPQQQQSISMMGNGGTGFWGVSSGWNGALPNVNSSTTSSNNIWGGGAGTGLGIANPNMHSAAGGGLLNTADIWGCTTGQANGGAIFFAAAGAAGVAQQPVTATTTTKKDPDVFGDLWGDFN